MQDTLGACLFTYAVVTDTHVNFGETQCNSEFEINKGANGRLRHVVRDLNRRPLAFVIHLGDIVHPVPAVPDLYEMAAECFREQVAKLRHPLHLVPGNHDIGDKPINWGLGGVACDDYIKLWTKNFGVNYQAFDHQGCRFFMVDTQILNSGLTAEAEQKVWLETEMADAAAQGLRIFVHTHYPLYLTAPDEDEHFDNIAEPGRSWLLGLLARHGADAQFSGHVHNFWFNRFGVTNCYALPSTAFVRQDYAEMYRAAPLPGTEGGRSDLAKLGYFLVHVHEHGHICRWVRTYGALAEPQSPDTPPADRVTPVHPLQNPHSRFGFDMRQNWLEVVEIPPSGSLDEFDRKRTRNDYALMALVETGVRRVRIPLSDLLNPEHRARLDECACLGLRFTLFSFGIPDDRLLDAVRDAEGLVDIWEICHTTEDLPAVVDAVRATVKAAGVSLYLSRLRTKEDQESGGGIYHHMIVHGFSPDDEEQIGQMAGLTDVDGLVFRIEGATSPWQAAQSALDACREHDLKASLHIRMTKGAPGLQQTDDDWVATRLAEAVAAACAFDDIHVYADTFADVDRGYYRRHGVVDRFYNPRPAFQVVRNLIATLAKDPAWSPGNGGAAIVMIGSRGRYVELVQNASPSRSGGRAIHGSMIDLHTGENIPVAASSDGRNGPPSTSPLSIWVGETSDQSA
ncbi:MAG: metallophosphoesterase [Alphaproteobacteria bacterium]|nr:metallophosphoesterase [Alphaproteobacteria bacterium]